MRERTNRATVFSSSAFYHRLPRLILINKNKWVHQWYSFGSCITLLAAHLIIIFVWHFFLQLYLCRVWAITTHSANCFGSLLTILVARAAKYLNSLIKNYWNNLVNSVVKERKLPSKLFPDFKFCNSSQVIYDANRIAAPRFDFFDDENWDSLRRSKYFSARCHTRRVEYQLKPQSLGEFFEVVYVGDNNEAHRITSFRWSLSCLLFWLLDDEEERSEVAY